MKIKTIKKSSAFTVDIEVENTHCYQLDNGVVSHNTVSLLSGSTPGVHPAFSEFYIRRIRISSNDALVKLSRDAGYKVEYALRLDGSEDRGTVVVEFPCSAGKDSVLVKDMSAIRQLEMVKKLQTVWSDNSVSVTVYYKPEELPEIQEWMKENYECCCKTLSFLLHRDHGFKQAPYEEIDEATYLRLQKKTKPIGIFQNGGEGLLENLECASGGCPIR